MAHRFAIDVSYNQLAMFDSSLESPFNDWTDQHVAQGFSWRPGSACFRTLIENGLHNIELDVVDHLPPLGTHTIRAIEVPFDVPNNGEVEVASISDGVSLSLAEGKYLLRYELQRDVEKEARQVILTLSRGDKQRFAIDRADDAINASGPLLTTATIAGD